MARKKRAKKHHSSRAKRRVSGGAGMQGLEMLAGVVGGVLTPRIAKKFIPATVNEKIVAAVFSLGGGVLAWYGKGAFLKGLGMGLAAGGAQNALQAFGVITGGSVGKPIVFTSRPGLNGFRDVPRVGAPTATNGGGFPKPSAVGSRRRMTVGEFYGGGILG